MLYLNGRAVEDVLLELVDLVRSLQALEDSKIAEVSLGAISKSEEFERASAIADLLKSLSTNLMRSGN